MRPARTLVLAALLAALACNKKSPPTPSPGPSGVETIRGTERLGWDQGAADRVELAAFRYAIYVDGARSEIADVTCGSAAGANGFPCSGRLPAMSPGQHTLELAAFIVDGNNTLESARSAPLRVSVTASTAGLSAGSLRAASAGTTSDGVPLRLDVIADLDEPSDIAFAPDGRLFVAEREGVIRVFDRQSRQTRSQLDGEILALALDREFERTRHLFVALATRIPQDEGAWRDALSIVRYREVNGTLGERMILLHEVPVRQDRAAAAIAVGPDGKLYVALDDGGVANSPLDVTSLNGKVLRLNRDGTTPDDMFPGAAVLPVGCHSPRALEWSAGGVLWIADGAPRAPERIAAWSPAARTRSTSTRAADGPRGRDGLVSYALAPGTDPSDAVFYDGDLLPSFRGDLLVAAEGGSHLLRVRLDPRSPTRVVATERLLEGVGPLRAIAVSPDGAIYVATSSSLARVTAATQNPSSLIPDPESLIPNPSSPILHP